MEFLLFPLVGLMILFVLGILAIVAVAALIKHRPGIAIFAGGLMLLAFLIPAGVIVSYASMRAGPIEEFGHPFDGAMHAAWPSSTSIDTGKISFFGILVIAVAALALLAALARRPAHGGEQSCRAQGGRWWPALLILPLIFFFFIGTVRTVRMKESQHHAPVPRLYRQHEQRTMEGALRQQEQELARRTAEIRRRIERMDIHKLMDQFDAPRIVISGPQPATIPWLALAPLAASSVARIGDSSAADAVITIENELADSSHEDEQLQVEASAAVKLIAAEAEESDSVSENDDASAADATHAAAVAADAKKTAEAEDWNETGLSTPIGAENAEPKVDTHRPEWVKFPPKRVGELQREVVVTDEWSTESECERERDVRLMLKTYEHVQRLVCVPYLLQHSPWERRGYSDRPTGGDYRLQQLQSAGITLDYVRREIAKDEYLETVERSVGLMKKLHTLVEFSPSVDRDLRVYWDSYRRQERLAAVGFGAGGILGLLGFTYGLLKVDTWTKGYYTKRLFLGVPAAIISVVTLLALLVSA